ncbi:unnamed protein product, partial [Prorocentrum cordatum]
GSAFGGVPQPKVPVVRSPAMQSQREVALERQLADLQRQLQQLQQPAADTGTAPAPVPPWATEASPQAARRTRLAEIGNILKSLGTADADYRAKLLAERTALQEQLQSEKPLESNVIAQNRKVTGARKKKANCAAKVQAARDAVEKAKDALAKAEAAETEAATNLLSLENELRDIVARGLPVGGEAKPPTLSTVIPGLKTTVSQLGEVLQSLGGSERFAAGMQAMAELVAKLEQEPAAAQQPPPPAAEPEDQAEEDDEEMAVDQEEDAHKHIDEMDAPTCREHLRSCGLQVPAPGDVDDDDEAPVLRDRLKRHLASAQSLAKKIKATAKFTYVCHAYGACDGRLSISFVIFVEFDGLRAPCEGPPCEFSGPGIGWRGACEYLFDLGHARTYAECSVMAVQETHVDQEHLADKQHAMLDAGWKGLWAPAIRSDSGAGTTGGVAVLVPSHITATAPPQCDSHILIPGRAVACHVRWGLPGGLVVISVYLKDGEGLGATNCSHVWALVQYVCRLNALQMPWIICADWNMETDELNKSGWMEAVSALAYVSALPSCRHSQPGSFIDFFVASSMLAARLHKQVLVDEEASTYPHLPISIGFAASDTPMWARVPDEPKPFPAVPPVGCARPPVYPWTAVLEVAGPKLLAHGDLAGLWDLVISGIEFELSSRWDRMEARTYKDPSTKAWATALGWAKHLGKCRQFLAKEVAALQECAAICELTPNQHFKLLRALAEASNFMIK